MMSINQINTPTKIYYGEGSLSKIAEEVDKLVVRRSLIVSDPGVYGAGLVELVREQLVEAGISVDVFTEAEPEPTVERLNTAAGKLSQERFDLLVGVGGGSSIDTAKGLSVLLAFGGEAEDYVGIDRVPGPGIALYALPTTSGSGSEVTPNAIFSIPEKKTKPPIVSPYIYPKLAIVDPNLTYSCPPQVTASAGIDALVHAIEAYTSMKASTFTDALQIEAIRLIASGLKRAVVDGEDKEARLYMAEGSLLAGIGIAHAGGAAVHALAYHLGSNFHVTHGVANGVLLPYVLEYNLPANYVKYANIARMFGVSTEGLSRKEIAEQGLEWVRILKAEIGIPAHLRELGVPREALEEMAIATMKIARLLDNNPRQLTLDDACNILQKAW